MASLSFNIAADQSQIAKVDAALGHLEGAADKALRAAMADTLRKFKTLLVDQILEVHGAKRSEIFDLVFTRNNTGNGEYSGVVTVSRKKVPLIDFRTKSVLKRSGVRVEMMTGDPQEHFRHAFKARMKSGHEGIFNRIARSAKTVPVNGAYNNRLIKRGPRKGQYLKRQPLHELFGPPIVDVFERKPDLTERVTIKLGETFETTLDAKIKWQLELAAKK